MASQPRLRSIYRIDKFIVPQSARDEFMIKLKETHALLDTMEGCLQNLVLEQVSGPGQFNVVTVVEWENASAFERAKTAMMQRRERDGFDPQELFARLGITPDLANYARPPADNHITAAW